MRLRKYCDLTIFMQDIRIDILGIFDRLRDWKAS